MSDWNSDLIDYLRSHDGEAPDGPFKGRQLLILTTNGAKSGETREAPLVYSTDGDRLVIIASMGGAPTHPAWYHNIVADPHVTIEAAGQKFRGIATIADPVERRRLYDQHAELHPSFTEYEAKTGGRVIPVITVQREAAQVAA